MMGRNLLPKEVEIDTRALLDFGIEAEVLL